MLYLSRLDMERIAQRVLRAYRKLPEAQECPACVDPKLLARKVLGMTVRYRHLSEDGELLGMTSYGELEVFLPDEREHGACILDGKTILIEEELLFSACGPGRHNFTLCHECAHQILKMLYPASYGDGTAARRARCCRRHRLCARGSGHDWEEWQMDVLASELLMPRDLLERNLALAGIPKGIPLLNPVWRREDYGRFLELCRMMGVSKQALAYRLELLGLLGRNQMADPNSLIDVFAEEEEAV